MDHATGSAQWVESMSASIGASRERSPFPLFRRLPAFEEYTTDLILDRFLDYAQEKGLELYPAQEEAVLALFEGSNVILNTPTGSGKSLVATALHYQSLAQGKKSYYTCPIKALVNEKFMHLCKEFGPEQVGLMTGDGSVNRDAPIICCTAEILSNLALREGENAKVDDVIMDEFHYYSDRERGVAWQIPLLSLPRTRFLLMSATLGEMEFFEKALTELTDRPTAIVTGSERPVPLDFEYRETPLHETVKELIDRGSAPIYLVNFTQREAAEQAQNLMSVDFSSRDEKKAIGELIGSVDFSSPYGKEMQKYLKHGVGLHHAGLLPKYRVLVEKLAQEGRLKVISGTDTLGVGVNVPIRTVVFTKLCKYDGEKTAILSVRDFHQIAGRAGRKGFDTRGTVVAQAPEHVIENLRLEAKAKADPKKAKKIVRAKPPERGYVPWSEDTFKKLVSSKPESLTSRFAVSHGMLLSVLSRESEDGCRAMRDLIRKSHEPEGAKKKHRDLGFTLFRSLVDRKIIEILPRSERGGSARKVRVHADLQEDFSLMHALSLYLLDTIEVLDRTSETYALDVLTLVEAILENPDLVLRKQLDRVKTEKMREMKEAGMEYEERMEELEKLEHPKPLREFIYETFNVFSDAHPWVGTDNIRPKSVAREMFELYLGFGEYVREYELQRAEGLLLRYLSEVYKALTQTVPAAAKTEEVEAIVEYFGAMVKQVDSSLVDEWERLKNPEAAAKAQAERNEAAQARAEAASRADSEKKAIRLKVMNEIYAFVRLISIRDIDGAFETLRRWAGGAVPLNGDGVEWTPSTLEATVRSYHEDGHRWIVTDPSSRRPALTHVSLSDVAWRIDQRLVDPDGNDDWHLRIELDFDRAANEGALAMKLLAIEPVG